MDINKLVRENILKLRPYSSARDEFEGEASVFLDANENPYPSDYNRYPDPHQKQLKKRISELKKINEEQIFLGNGSDEAMISRELPKNQLHSAAFKLLKKMQPRRDLFGQLMNNLQELFLFQFIFMRNG